MTIPTQMSVIALAKLAGVSVRTLHHYDEIGLLMPSGRSAAGYRLYSRQDLFTLQQILTYRELGLSLAQIRDIMHEPQYHLLDCLKQQSHQLYANIQQQQQLLQMVQLAIEHLESGMKLDDASQLFNGFSEQILREEAIEKWGESAVSVGDAKRQQLSDDDKGELDKQGEQIAAKLAALRHLPASDEAVQLLMEAQFQWLQRYGECPIARLQMLGEMYVTDERFRQYYDRFGAGTAALMRQGLIIFAEKHR